MRDQYAGDISDFLKFSFLRALVSNQEIKLGIGWFYVDVNDGRPDGKHTEYLEQTHLRDLDPVLFDHLSNIPERSVKALQELPVWKDTTSFHATPMPIENSSASRQVWSWEMARKLSGCNVVFIDPDNSVTWSDSVSNRHAQRDEIQVLAAGKRPLIFIKFPGRDKKHPQQIADLHQQFDKYSPMTVTTSASIPTANGGKIPRARWFTILNPTSQLRKNAQEFSKRLNIFPDASSAVHD